MRFSLLALAVVSMVFSNPLCLSAADSMPPGKDAAPMVLVPAGSFPMGVPEGDRDGGRDEYPRHDVHLDDQQSQR